MSDPSSETHQDQVPAGTTCSHSSGNSDEPPDEPPDEPLKDSTARPGSSSSHPQPATPNPLAVRYREGTTQRSAGIYPQGRSRRQRQTRARARRSRRSLRPALTRPRAGAPGLRRGCSPGRLEQLDHAAARILEQDLRAAGSGHDVVAEPPAYGAEPLDLRIAASRLRLPTGSLAGTGPFVSILQGAAAYRSWSSRVPSDARCHCRQPLIS